MNSKQASRRVEPVRNVYSQRWKFLLCLDGNEKPSGNDFSTSRTLKKVHAAHVLCIPRFVDVHTFSRLFCIAVRFDTCVAQNRFLRNFTPLSLPALLQVISKQLGLRFIASREPRGINLQDEQWLKILIGFL